MEMLKGIYGELMALRFKREAPKLLENLFSGWFRTQYGVVFEVVEESKDLRLRNHWGIAQTRPDVLAAIASFKDNLIVKWASERKDVGTLEEIQKDINLVTALEKFDKGLFELAMTVPVTVQDRPVFVLFLGKPTADAPVALDFKQFQPILAALSMSLVKIGAKDARPSFSTFMPGS
ncbi:MAG: hypothetical protein HY815_23730 [Candidatus Riflebacteria bacterium]|nr:hypothetical protein [Candidatus Riflebacteria bacterium]